MWCGFGKSGVSIITACLITTSIVVSDAGFAAPARNYTPRQFRAVLRGLGYKVKVTNDPLTNKDAVEAIREFQRGYKLKPVDGKLNTKTQDFAANIIQILQANLNLVLKPNPPLPRDQFYGPRTEATVKAFQKKFQLEETGIADLVLRQRLDEEARKLVNKEPETEPVTPTPKPSPTKKPQTKPKPTPTKTPSPEATPTETPSPEATPTETPSLEATPTETPSLEATPTSTPTPKK